MEIKKGGKRAGAGRKPLGLKKRSIFLYVEGNLILKFGSEQKMKDILYEFIKSYGEHDEKTWEGKLLDGETEPFKNHGLFIPQEPNGNYFTPTQEKRVLNRTYDQYLALKKDCISQEEWAELSDEIRNSNLFEKQKAFLLKPF